MTRDSAGECVTRDRNATETAAFVTRLGAAPEVPVGPLPTPEQG